MKGDGLLVGLVVDLLVPAVALVVVQGLFEQGEDQHKGQRAQVAYQEPW